MPIRSRFTFIFCASLAMLLTLSAAAVAAAPEFDVFGRPVKEDNMIPAGTRLCKPVERVETAPVFVKGVKPLYPFGNLLDSKDGSATIRYRINEDGKTTVIASDTAGSSTGRKWFGNHAMLAVGSWLFEPARRGGVAVALECEITFSFAIDR